MKLKWTRVLAFLLIFMILIPTFFTLAISADEGIGENEIDISDIVNLYELNQLNACPNTEKVAGAKDKAPTVEEGMLASKPFAVTTGGDKYIYVGPCADPEKFGLDDYIVYWYKKDGSYYGSKSIYELKGDAENGGNVVGRFENGSVILRIKINQKTYQKFAAIKVPNTYADIMLVTCERSFTVEEYYAYAEKQGWAVNGVLRPMPPTYAEEAPEGYEGLWNLFPRQEEYDTTLTQQDAANEYKLSENIPVQEGDVITIGGISAKESKGILYAFGDVWKDGTFNEIKQYKKTDEGMKLVETLDDDFAIYSFTVPEGVSNIKICAQLGIYNNGDIFVTRNQSFTSLQLREALEIAEDSDEVKAHPFYGKKALFVGDSIFYGAYDTPSSYSVPAASFARRLELATGLVSTNVSYPGASIGKTDLKNVVWEYDLLTTALIAKKNYDMVIFQGGINDALKNVPVGEVLPADTDRNVLTEENRVATFAGGLQLMFHDTKIKWPEAELYYIANYKTADIATSGADMTAYYAQAKALCQAYGVHYIDLYNDAELYHTFDYENAELFADDFFTPTSTGYDLLFPTVLRLFNNTLESKTSENISFESSNTSNATSSQLSASTSNQTSVNASQSSCSAANDCEGAPIWLTFLNNILNFFRRLFGLPELCTCGAVLNKE